MSLAGAIALIADRELLARIGGPHGERARDIDRELQGMKDPGRRLRRAQLAAMVRMPVPPGLRGIDASWIEHALVELPARARVVVADASVATDVEVWLARWATATFPPMLPTDPDITRPAAAHEIARMTAPSLRAWLDDVGADQIAFAVGDQAARTLGPLVARASQRIQKAPRRDELGPRREAILRAKIGVDEVALVRIAGRAIAPHVGLHADLAAQLAHRLPYSVGRVLLGELAGGAATLVAHVPTWRALAALS